MTIQLSDPDGDGGEFDEAHEVGEQFVISGCDTPEVFEFVEEALDQVALLVEVFVVGALGLAVAFGRDDDSAALPGDLFDRRSAS